MDKIFGKQQKQQVALASEAQAQSDVAAAQATADAQASAAAQKKAVDDENVRLSKIEAGQRALRKQGRGGLLSFIDRPGAGGEDLRTKFGG